MMVRPRSMQPLTSAASSASVPGVSTTKGYSTRQSVASVTWLTRARPSNWMLSLTVRRPSVLRAWRGSRAPRPQLGPKPATAPPPPTTPPPTTPAPGAPPGPAHSPPQPVALRIVGWPAAFFDLAQPVLQRIDQQLAARRVVQQVVLQIGVALHHPDVAQHLVEHAGRAPRAALIAQLVERIPGRRPQQTDHDLPVGERGVVVGNFAQTRR